MEENKNLRDGITLILQKIVDNFSYPCADPPCRHLSRFTGLIFYLAWVWPERVCVTVLSSWQTIIECELISLTSMTCTRKQTAVADNWYMHAQRIPGCYIWHLLIHIRASSSALWNQKLGSFNHSKHMTLLTSKDSSTNLWRLPKSSMVIILQRNWLIRKSSIPNIPCKYNRGWECYGITTSHVSDPRMTSTYIRLTARTTRPWLDCAVFTAEPDRCTDSSMLGGPITFAWVLKVSSGFPGRAPRVFIFHPNDKTIHSHVYYSYDHILFSSSERNICDAVKNSCIFIFHYPLMYFIQSVGNFVTLWERH